MFSGCCGIPGGWRRGFIFPCLSAQDPKFFHTLVSYGYFWGKPIFILVPATIQLAEGTMEGVQTLPSPSWDYLHLH